MIQTVIFDLGGVLVQEAEANLHRAQDERLRHFFLANKPVTKIFNRAFEFASLFCGPTCKHDWIVGTISGDAIVAAITAHIDTPEYAGFFKDEDEKVLIKYGIPFVLQPELLVTLTDSNEEGLAFVSRCKQRGIRTAIISNWDPVSFMGLKKKMPQLFNLFDDAHIVLPCMVGATKPSVAIYEYALKLLGADASNCFFIDDSKANVEGARKLGMPSVHHSNWQQTEYELKTLGLEL